jgi:NAD(P)H-dependent FMN reductase
VAVPLTPPPVLVVGFSGKREIPDPARVAAGIDAALEWILRATGSAAGGRPLVALSAVAEGADTLFAEAVLARGIPWRLILPFPPADFFAAFASPAARERAEKLAARAGSIEFPETAPDGLPVRPLDPDPDEKRCTDAAHARCGVRLVDAADMLVIVTDGAPARGPGGSSEILQNARARGKPCVVIHRDTGEIEFPPTTGTDHRH